MNRQTCLVTGRHEGRSMSSPVQLILSRLTRIRQTGPGTWRASCPTEAHPHGDRSMGLAIREAGDGSVLIHCFSGCPPDKVLAAISLSMSSLFPDRDGRDPAYRGGRPKAPPIPWRDVVEALHLDLCACSLAFSDLAAGKTFSPQDAVQFAKFADDLAGKLREVGHGR